jgi:hypothetical protein
VIDRLDAEIETAVRAGAVRALRTRAKAQAQNAANGQVQAGDKYPGVVIRSGESAIASELYAALSAIADELEQGTEARS